jgi:hypothetical protein
MEDIIASMPWCCGEKGCPAQWHVIHYWMYSDGTYRQCDSDGNHESCDEEDVPSHAEVDKAWREYSAYVLRTGLDPLGEFQVARERKEAERWTVWFNRGLCGWVVARAKRGKTLVPASDLPQHVIDYCIAHRTNAGSVLVDLDWREFLECNEIHALRPADMRCRGDFRIERKVPRKDSAITRDLRRLARRRLREKC